MAEHRQGYVLYALELQRALGQATQDGVLDELAVVLHPDVINQFCDAVDLLVKSYKAQERPAR